MLKRPREHLLKDVLGVVRRQPIGLNGDRVHVTGKSLDEQTPRLLVPGSARAHQLTVGHRP